MSREEECDLLQSMIRDELEILRCDSQGGCLPDNAWDKVHALTAGLQALKEQEVAQQPSAKAEDQAELLRTLCKTIAQSQAPWDADIMNQLLAVLDAGLLVTDPLTVALLTPNLIWAKHLVKPHLASDRDFSDEIYATMLLWVIPAVCPELREQEEDEINDGET